MPRILPKRKNPVVDMTAMCDVAFLLLTFFILTAKFKPQSVVAVDLPNSRSKTQIDNVCMITVNKEGKVFLSIKEVKVREEMLNQLIEKYGDKYPDLTKIGNKEKDFFKLVDTWGTPIEDMQRVLNFGDGLAFKEYQETMPGIPIDSVHSQIADWVQSSRYASRIVTNNDIKIAIKGDKNANVFAVKDVIKRLTEADIHRFLLITMLNAGPSEVGEEQEQPQP